MTQPQADDKRARVYTDLEGQPSLGHEIRALAQSHPVPSEEKMVRRNGRIERMARFYEEKAVDAPEKQGLMFSGFVSALMYALTIIKMYRQLTMRLAELADEGVNHEHRERKDQ